MSTFHGLEMAKQALFAQQSALYTTGHNIANANTEGYSRQRVNFETNTPFPAGSRNRPQIPGQMGTGVKVGDVQRIRDEYLDMQFRGENSKVGYWETRAEALGRLENLFNEPSDTGLSAVMDQFWESLQDLSVNPENSGARSVVLQRGQALAETFNYLSDTLHSIRDDLQQQIDVTITDANSLIKQIHDINKQVSELEPHGYVANDLYDKRDKLVDELSSIMNIKVTDRTKADSAKEIADGSLTIVLMNDDGNPITNGNGEPITLVDGENLEYAVLEEKYLSDSEGFNLDNSLDAVSQIQFQMKDINDEPDEGSTAEDIQIQTFLESSGSLKALIEAYGHGDAEGEENYPNYPTGDFPEMLEELDEMVLAFVNEFNNVHRGGIDLNGHIGKNFFGVAGDGDGEDNYKNPFGSAGEIHVLIEKSEEIAAAENYVKTNDNEEVTVNDGNPVLSGEGNSGNGMNAKALADVFDEKLSGLDNSSVRDFYESIIGELGVTAQQANRMTDNTVTLRSQVENQRMSVSSVSLDEEMTNLLKFQHAYNAAARSLTATDELLDRIINNMGLVGR